MIASSVTKRQDVHNYFNQYQNIVRDHAHETELTSVVEEKIKKQLDQGNIEINDKKDSCSNIRKLNKQIQIKKQKLNKGLLLLDMNLNQSAYFKRKVSNQSRMGQSTRSLRKIDIETARQQFDEYRNQQIKSFERLKNLKKMKQELTKQRQFNQLLKKIKQQKRCAQIREQELQSEHLKRVEKLNKISERIKKLEENRVERVQKLKSSIAKSSPTLPKYKLMRYQFDASEIDFQLKEKERLQYIKMNKMIENNMDNIKQHQIQYIKKKQMQKSSLLLKNKNQDFVERQKNYNKLSQNPQKIEFSKKKNIRIKEYQNETNENRKKLKLDPKIGIQIQAAKDKAKHPFKYHYLKKKKHLTDIQIYQNFNHFNFNSDPIQMGKAYLQQLKALNSQSRVSLQSKKRSKTNESQLSDRRSYKNYLQDSKKNSHKKQISEVDQLIKLHGQKSKVLEILQKKANGQTEAALKKITKLKAPNTYSKTLEIQQEIDNDFINSIKTKLKCLQIK